MGLRTIDATVNLVPCGTESHRVTSWGRGWQGPAVACTQPRSDSGPPARTGLHAVLSGPLGLHCLEQGACLCHSVFSEFPLSPLRCCKGEAVFFPSMFPGVLRLAHASQSVLSRRRHAPSEIEPLALSARQGGRGWVLASMVMDREETRWCWRTAWVCGSL